MMYPLITIVAGVVILASCSERSPSDKNASNGFEVSGTIKNSDAKMIYLLETPIAGNPLPPLDSATLDNIGKFSLKAKTKEESIYSLVLESSPYPFVSLINDVNKVKVMVDFNNKTELYTVEGSPASQSMKDYLMKSGDRLRSIYNLDQHMDSVFKQNSADNALKTLIEKRTTEATALKTFTTEFINSSKSPVLTLFALGSYQSMASNSNFRIEAYSSEQLTGFINEGIKKFPDHKGLLSVKRAIEDHLEKGKGWVGKQAPEISLPDAEGKEISLNSFRGKYVLVDFWASWCKPCRRENPNKVMAYNKFKDKNFAILGVSLDKPGKKDKWLKAVADDKLTWTHVSDLKYWESPVVLLYNIQGIPFNVLVDPQGMIVAENLRGADLENKLQEVLK